MIGEARPSEKFGLVLLVLQMAEFAARALDAISVDKADAEASAHLDGGPPRYAPSRGDDDDVFGPPESHGWSNHPKTILGWYELQFFWGARQGRLLPKPQLQPRTPTHSRTPDLI